MKLKDKLAKTLTEMSVKAARKAAGQVSVNGTYQPKEPASLNRQKK
jgi:cyclic lactone autoinducer peptide